MGRRRSLAAALAAAGLLLALPAAAHDSWLAAAARAGEFALATGNRYPAAESAPPAASLAQAGCVDGGGRRHPLRAGAESPRALQLQSAAGGALACWVALQPYEITLEPRLVAVYFREIRPSEAVRNAWAEQMERGVAWTERYVKFARIERGTAAAPAEALRRLRAPIGWPLEIVVAGEQPLRVAGEANFQVLARGRPLAGLPVELVSERSPLGIWAVSDAAGRIRHRLPFGGGWLLRATLVEAAAQPNRWHSRFVTLAFEAD